MALSINLYASSFSGHTDDTHDASPNAASSGQRRPLREDVFISPSLITRIQARDPHAFRDLILCFASPLIHYARSIVDSTDDAEDVVQDVFTSIWQLGSQWNPSGDPVAYLFASVRNRSLDERRRKARADQRAYKAHLRYFDLAPDESATQTRTAIDQIIDDDNVREHIKHVTEILDTLPERQRTAYELRYRQGLTISGVAEVLGTTAKGAENLVARVTKLVMERLRVRVLGQ